MTGDFQQRSGLSLSLLGGVQLHWQGQPLPLSAKRLLGVLAYLHLNGPTPRSELGEVFWPGQGASAVRQGLYTLRGLKAAKDWLQDGPEVTLNASSDVQHIQELLTSDPPDALELLRQAGPLLGHLTIPELPAFTEWLEEQRSALQEQERAALRHAARQAQTHNQYGAARTHLQRLLILDPLEETSYRDLMHLEQQAGQPEAALDVFETLRRTLQTELQSEPSAETLALLRQLEGHEISGQTRAQLLPPAQSGDTPAHDPLCGRHEELSAIQARLNGHQRALIQGMAGMGKTRLAQAVAEHHQQNGGHALWLEIGQEAPEVLLPALTEPLGLRTIPARSNPAPLHAALTEKKITLVILDNAANSYALSVLLEYLPAHLPVLVTSRLRLPRLPTLTLHRLPRQDALTLMHTHLHGEGDPPDPYSLDALCAILGDHPYALRLAAITLQQTGHPPRELLQTLSEAPHALGAEHSVKTLLQQSLSALNAESYEAYLGMGSLFTPQTTPELLALALRRPVGDTENALYNLLQHGLTTREAREGSDHVTFRMHELTWHDAKTHASLQAQTVVQAVRQYAQANTGTPDALHTELPNLIAGAGHAEKTNPEELVKIMVGWLSGQYIAARGYPVGYMNLVEQALSSTEAQQDWEKAALIAGKLADINISMLNNAEQAISFYLRGAKHAQAANMITQQANLTSLAGFLQSKHRFPEAEQTLRQAEVLAEESGDALCQARMLEFKGMQAAAKKEFGEAGEFIDLARDLIRPLLAVGHPQVQAAQAKYSTLTSNLGEVNVRLGKLDQALKLKLESLDIAKRIGEQYRVAIAHMNVGEVLTLRGDYQAASASLEQARGLFRALGAVSREQNVLELLRKVSEEGKLTLN